MSNIQRGKASQAKYRAHIALLGIRLKEAMASQCNVRVDRVVIVPDGFSYVVLAEGKNRHSTHIAFEVLLQDKFIVTIVLTQDKKDTRYSLMFDTGERVHNLYKSIERYKNGLNAVDIGET